MNHPNWSRQWGHPANSAIQQSGRKNLCACLFHPMCFYQHVFFEGKMVHVGNLGVILGQMRWNFWVCPGLRRHADLKGQVHIFVWIHQFFSSIHLFCHCHSSRVVILTATSTKIVNKLKVRLAQIQTINASHIFMYIILSVYYIYIMWYHMYTTYVRKYETSSCIFIQNSHRWHACLPYFFCETF